MGNAIQVNPQDPSPQFATVTPVDGAKLKYDGQVRACVGISFAVAGALAIKDDVGNTVVIPINSLSIGRIHAISTDEILDTGTDATGIVVYF